jgi:hypothetical protein
VIPLDKLASALVLLRLPRVLDPRYHSFILLQLGLWSSKLWDVSSHCLLFVLVLLLMQIQMHLLQVRMVWSDLVGSGLVLMLSFDKGFRKHLDILESNPMGYPFL